MFESKWLLCLKVGKKLEVVPGVHFPDGQACHLNAQVTRAGFRDSTIFLGVFFFCPVLSLLYSPSVIQLHVDQLQHLSFRHGQQVTQLQRPPLELGTEMNHLHRPPLRDPLHQAAFEEEVSAWEREKRCFLVIPLASRVQNLTMILNLHRKGPGRQDVCNPCLTKPEPLLIHMK